MAPLRVQYRQRAGRLARVRGNSRRADCRHCLHRGHAQERVITNEHYNNAGENVSFVF